MGKNIFNSKQELTDFLKESGFEIEKFILLGTSNSNTYNSRSNFLITVYGSGDNSNVINLNGEIDSFGHYYIYS